ncbi:2-dehydro-3-deoxy-L-rhamnonate dehydrogenase (NAD(+)) [Chelatococcus asaccharovorans]|nr:2-dehydro-3-deoxy-L-rhamnonate dehydrogenase (NAD(+)) [Chelatococcus asaccharovorans]CAH1684243.1 2-dehydro-3-deoxy-L-rhamnonate dehydrogenase (NAD(+)) [Chelatococcus asaccharovorans]
MPTMVDQVAIVTGGAKGIGAGIAAELISRGCRVIIWDRQLVEAMPAAAAAHTVDITKPEIVAAAVQDAASAFGKIDIFINNAGVNGPVKSVDNYSDTEWEQVLAVNLTGVFNCCRAVVPVMRQSGYGRIVNIASIAGKEGMPGIAAYSAAKAGVIGFTKALAREVVTDGITVNALAPAITETDLFREMTAEHIESARSRIPMGRFCTLEEIAATAAWVASPACSFTTGSVFDLSGGRATY